MVGEGDGERVQCGFPSCDPFYLPLAGRVQRPDGQVQALQRGLLVGEVAARPDGAAEPGVEAIGCATLLMILFASLLRILYSTCAKRWNSAKILFAWYLLGWVAKRGCGTILSGGALWRRAFLANRGKETGP